jgi:hypothetical protein
MADFYKILAPNRNCIYGGSGQWLPEGQWMPSITGKLKPCENGYHVLKKDQIVLWLKSEVKNVLEVWEVAIYEDCIFEFDKCVARRACLMKKICIYNVKFKNRFENLARKHAAPLFGDQARMYSKCDSDWLARAYPLERDWQTETLPKKRSANAKREME